MPNPTTQQRADAPRRIDSAAHVDTSHLLDAVSVAEYIHDFSTQFATLAERVELPLLAYLLDMVRLEANLVTTRVGTSRGTADPATNKRLRAGRHGPPR